MDRAGRRRRWWLGCATFGVALLLAAVAAGASRSRGITARAAIVMDAATGRVLWARRPDIRLPPASTTKVMTAILALESGKLDRLFRVSARATRTVPAKLGLVPGQRVRLRDLVYALLLNSANDAAVVVAEGLAGSVRAFAARMNRKARALGARHTHFINPHGLSARGHYTSARDLAKIFRYAYRNPLFRRIAATRARRITVYGRRAHTVRLHNHNRLLRGYRTRVVGKTGYTRAAGRCFVGATSFAGREVVVAILGARSLWRDARRLLDLAAARVGKRGVVRSRAARRAGRIARAERRAKAAVPSRAHWSTYTVRLGPFSSRAEAEGVRRRLAHRGYGAVLEATDGTVSLRVGRFASRNRAERIARRLRSAEPSAVVTGLAP